MLEEYNACWTCGDIPKAGMHIDDVVAFKRRCQNEEILVLHDISLIHKAVKAEEGLRNSF